MQCGISYAHLSSVAGACGNAKVLYAASMSKKSAPHSRVIPQRPDRILDAPELLDDYC